MAHEREALEDLLSSDGWLLFKEQARKQWGPEGYGKKLAGVMANYQDDPIALGHELRKVHTATEEINALMKWPEEQLKRTEVKPDAAPSMYRGGR